MKEAKKPETGISPGGFIASILLDEAVWDKNKLAADLKADWGIDVYADLKPPGEYQDIIVSEIEDMRLAISLIPEPVPNGEAEYYACD